jgi:four helix bundle protein
VSDSNDKTYTNKNEFVQLMLKRTKAVAVAVIKYTRTLPDTPVMRVIRYQIIKISTSMASNYRAACRARSNREFFAKLSISVEECDETCFWIEIINETGIDNSNLSFQLHKEDLELLNIMSAARRNTKF